MVALLTVYDKWDCHLSGQFFNIVDFGQVDYFVNQPEASVFGYFAFEIQYAFFPVYLKGNAIPAGDSFCGDCKIDVIICGKHLNLLFKVDSVYHDGVIASKPAFGDFQIFFFPEFS